MLEILDLYFHKCVSSKFSLDQVLNELLNWSNLKIYIKIKCKNAVPQSDKLHFKCSVASSDCQPLCWALETNVSGFQLWVSHCLMVFVLGLKLLKTL